MRDIEALHGKVERKSAVEQRNASSVQTLQGAGEVLWDGRDQTGSRVAPGMYVLMIEQGLRTQVVKLLVE